MYTRRLTGRSDRSEFRCVLCALLRFCWGTFLDRLSRDCLFIGSRTDDNLAPDSTKAPRCHCYRVKNDIVMVLMQILANGTLCTGDPCANGVQSGNASRLLLASLG